MTAEQIAWALSEHQPKTGIRDLHQHCTCGWFGKPLTGGFVLHQASKLRTWLIENGVMTDAV